LRFLHTHQSAIDAELVMSGGGRVTRAYRFQFANGPRVWRSPIRRVRCCGLPTVKNRQFAMEMPPSGFVFRVTLMRIGEWDIERDEWISRFLKLCAAKIVDLWRLKKIHLWSNVSLLCCCVVLLKGDFYQLAN